MEKTMELRDLLLVNEVGNPAYVYFTMMVKRFQDRFVSGGLPDIAEGRYEDALREMYQRLSVADRKKIDGVFGKESPKKPARKKPAHKKTHEYTFCYATAEVYISVTAKSEEQAEKKAWVTLEDTPTSLCHQCSGKVEPCDPYLVSVDDNGEA